MNSRDLKISTRLWLAFGVGVALSVAGGGYALSQLSAIQAKLDTVVLVNNGKMRLIRDLETASQAATRHLATIAVNDDKAAIDAEMPAFLKARAAYTSAWAALQKLPANEAEQALRARIGQAREQAAAVGQRVVELAQAQKSAEALALLVKDGKVASVKWIDLIGENIEMQRASTDQLHAQATINYAQTRNTLIAGNVLGVLLALLLGWRITRSITAPIQHARDAAESVAEGDLTVELESRGHDEAADLLHALAGMRDNLLRIVGGVRHNADALAASSAQIAQGNLDLKLRTEQQAQALERTAASMEQLGATVQQNADNAKQANQLALGASAVAVQGGEVVGRVVETMKGINDSSKRIADIISVIDGIAFQTNILALNAAVEAARAGEQGRGFAVVASEVRSLAGRSADAAKEIKALINASVDRVAQGTTLVDQAGATMTEVVNSIKRLTDIMGEISAASSEQSAGVDQVGKSIGQMDLATQQNASLVQQAAAAAEDMKRQAAELVTAMAVFKMHRSVRKRGNKAGANRPSGGHRSDNSYSGKERRGPHRATNVTRPKFGSQPGTADDTQAGDTHPGSGAERPAKAGSKAGGKAGGKAAAKTGTDADWSSF